MRLCSHDRLAQRDRGGANLVGGGEQARRRPEGMPTEQVVARPNRGTRVIPQLREMNIVAIWIVAWSGKSLEGASADL